jgi:hypothetical protein
MGTSRHPRYIPSDNVLFEAFEDDGGSDVFNDETLLDDEGSDVRVRGDIADVQDPVHQHIEDLLESD